MNKKQLNSVLILLLIFIWGSVIYKYFGHKKIIPETTHTIDIPLLNKGNFSVSKDTFELKLKDRDPFGISKKRTAPGIANNSIKANPKKKPEVKSVIWPNIAYYGFVKGEHNSSRLVLIKINNKLYRNREKEAIADIVIVKAFSDSVVVSFNKQMKTIKKINEKI